MTSEANRLRYSRQFERHGNYAVWSMEKSRSTAQHAYGQPKQARNREVKRDPRWSYGDYKDYTEKPLAHRDLDYHKI